MIFEAPRKQSGRFLDDIQNLKLEVVEPQDMADKRYDSEIEHFAFVKGRLEPEKRIAHKLPPDS